MKLNGTRPFDPKVFLAKVGDGKTNNAYQKNQVVFSQGDTADAVYYVQKGRVKLTVVSDQEDLLARANWWQGRISCAPLPTSIRPRSGSAP